MRSVARACYCSILGNFKMQVETTPNITGVKRTSDEHTADSSTRVSKRPRKYFQGPTSAFNYYAKDQRVAAKSTLDLLSSSERTPQLLRWWKEMPEDGRKTFVQLAHADKTRHATDTACLHVLQDVVADVCGEPRDLSLASNTMMEATPSSTPSTSTPLASFADRHPNLPKRTPHFMVYTSLCNKDSEEARVLHDILEQVVDMTTEKAPAEKSYEVTEGLRYSALIPNPGRLGFTLDGQYPREYDYKWVPIIAGIDSAVREI